MSTYVCVEAQVFGSFDGYGKELLAATKNDALTGTFSEQPVVWQNDNETIGLRCLTIPVEDFAYRLLLFLMMVGYYEVFKELLPLQKKCGYCEGVLNWLSLIKGTF